MPNVNGIHLVRPVASHRHALTARARPSTVPRPAHATALVGILLGMSLTVAIALLEDSPLAALELLLVVPVVAGVLSVAWMRPPSGSPEHHPAIDRLLDDTSP